MSATEQVSVPHFRWREITAAQFAGFERSQGEVIATINGIEWRQVRPFFYRPLLPFREYDPALAVAPVWSRFGGCQFAVPQGVAGNSRLNVLMFQDAKDYSLAGLDAADRRQVRSAAKAFTIREMSGVDEFKESAFPIYVSFYQRTEYRYKKDRLQKAGFSQWADALFQLGHFLLTGAYRNGNLEGISISQLVEDTVVYSSVFWTPEALRQNVSSLLLHSLRQSVASGGQAGQIFIGMHKSGAARRIDDFYLARGCSLLRKPAILRVNPAAAACLRLLLPAEHAKLFGAFEPSETAREHNPDGYTQRQN